MTKSPFSQKIWQICLMFLCKIAYERISLACMIPVNATPVWNLPPNGQAFFLKHTTQRILWQHREFLWRADFSDNTLSYLPCCLRSEPRATLVSVDQDSVGSHCFPLRLNLQNREKRWQSTHTCTLTCDHSIKDQMYLQNVN